MFKKGINFYWSFLNPKEEQQFITNGPVNNTLETATTLSSKKIKKTVSKSMFEDIKFKNGKYFIPKSVLNEFNDLGKIFSSISIRIYQNNNDIQFRIVYLAKTSVFYKLGLRRNDYITKTNNEKFKSANEPIKYFQDMKSLKQLSLTIKRNGQIKELRYEIY